MRAFTVPVYTITLILSAFLLFSVQPMFAKMILPLLGGSPSVWNTAMVFFQASLLGGYAYAHLTTRFLGPRSQAVLHIGLLLLGLTCLPFAVPAGAGTADASGNPVLWQMGVMLVALGLPFTVLSGTAPMLQRWFSTTTHKDAGNPYFLYAASNIGSLAALISYPVIVEVFFGTRQQALGWSWGYGILIAMLALAILMAGRTASVAVQTQKTPAPRTHEKLIWVILAFIPSSLMLSVTTYITTDIAAIPLLWIIPLTLYMCTFILAFSRRQPVTLKAVYVVLCAFIAISTMFFLKGIYGADHYAILVYLTTFFLAALGAHMAVAQRKPAADHLTAFYLYISLGGVLGGIFNTLVAPFIFPLPFEFPLVLLLTLSIPFLSAGVWPDTSELKRHAPVLLGIAIIAIGMVFISAKFMAVMACCLLILIGLLYLMDREAPFAFMVAVAIILITHPAYDWSAVKRTLRIERNFFGISKVGDNRDGTARGFTHGTTIHGVQALDGPYRMTPLTYFYPKGPAGDAFGLLGKSGKAQNIAVLGLGIGSVACYNAPKRHFDFYEIDPDVITIAEDKSLFTYLSDCGSPYKVIAGDGRLQMAKAPDHGYDMIFLDAFSSDSIPTHIVTREAFDLYFQKLKPGGFILANVSNKHLDLNPLLKQVASHLGADLRVASYAGEQIDKDNPAIRAFSARYAIITKNPSTIAALDKKGSRWRAYTGRDTRLWTDDYANFISLFAR